MLSRLSPPVLVKKNQKVYRFKFGKNDKIFPKLLGTVSMRGVYYPARAPHFTHLRSGLKISKICQFLDFLHPPLLRFVTKIIHSNDFI